jgi:hypothetical protein
MSGHGIAPKDPDRRRNRSSPRRGEWKASPGIGWQHTPFPQAPDGLTEASRIAWTTWLRAWFAAHWEPGDLPALRIMVLLFDQVERGKYQRAAELRMWLDGFGVTKKGQQDRRWAEPTTVEPSTPKPPRQYDHLRALPGHGA